MRPMRVSGQAWWQRPCATCGNAVQQQQQAAVGVETSQARLQLPPRAAPGKAKPLLNRLYNWPPAAASLRAVLLSWCSGPCAALAGVCTPGHILCTADQPCPGPLCLPK